MPSVSRLFPFAAPILQVLMLGANKGRWLCRQKQPFPFGSLDSSVSGATCQTLKLPRFLPPQVRLRRKRALSPEKPGYCHAGGELIPQTSCLLGKRKATLSLRVVPKFPPGKLCVPRFP